jgi:hypothetical protein
MPIRQLSDSVMARDALYALLAPAGGLRRAGAEVRETAVGEALRGVAMLNDAAAGISEGCSLDRRRAYPIWEAAHAAAAETGEALALPRPKPLVASARVRNELTPRQRQVPGTARRTA